MAKRGRPKLPKNAAKCHILTIRVTESEHKGYEHKAKADGISVSDWVRKTLNRYAEVV